MFSDEESKLIRKELVATKPQELETERFQKLYQPLLESIFHTDGIDSRTIATDSLSIWLLRASQCDDTETMSLVTEEHANKILDYVVDFWNDSGAALGNALKDLFRKLILITGKSRGNDELLYLWAERVLDLPRDSRVHYFMMEILIRQIGAQFVLQKDPEYPSQVLHYIDSNALANSISKTLLVLCNSMYKQLEFDEWVDLWAGPVRCVLKYPKKRNNLQIYFLTMILKFSPSSFPRFVQPLIVDLKGLEHNQGEQVDEMVVLIACLKLGQSLNIDIHKMVNIDLLECLLRHESRELRIGGLSLLVSSPQVSRPVEPHVYQTFMANIDNFLVDPDNGFRVQVVGLIRHFVSRLRSYSYALARDQRRRRAAKAAQGQSIASVAQNSEHDHYNGQESNIEACKVFLEQLLNYLKKRMRPGTPYHSMICAAQLLQHLVQAGLDDIVDSRHFEKEYVPFPFRVAIYTEDTIELLIGSLTNSYEVVRSLSSTLLHLAPLPLPALTRTRQIDQLASKGKRIISSIRGRDGDGGARVIDIVYRLYQSGRSTYLEALVVDIETNLQRAETDLVNSVRHHSVHGYFTSLKLIFEQISKKEEKISLIDAELVYRIINSAHRLWPLVENILCDDSPEGYMPHELSREKELEATYGPTSQVLSSYSWRGVKESVSLLKTMLEILPDSHMSDENVIAIGDMLITQLITIRHKGAFATVYPAFVACCKRCHSRPNLKSVPEQWLQKNIDSIHSHAQYVTRRSGGLPYVMTAVLIADPQPQKLLETTFVKLFSVAKEPAETTGNDTANLPQVHAFNYIKTLFSESELSRVVGSLVDRSLELAISSFGNEVWAIRNCAVMLYTALQTRIFGNKATSRVSARLFFTRYKTLKSVLLDHLTKHVFYLDDHGGDAEGHVESVYPALALLCRLQGSGSANSDNNALEEFRPLVMECLKSKIWKIREIAAKALVSLVASDEVDKFSSQLLQECSIERQNKLHGLLLALLQMNPSLDQELLESKFEELVEQNPSPETRLAFLRIMVQLSPSSHILLNYCQSSFEDNSKPEKLSSASRMVKKELARYWLDVAHSEEEEEKVMMRLLQFDSCYEVQQEAISFLTNRDGWNEHISQSLWKVFEESQWDQVRGPAVTAFSRKFKVHKSKYEHYWTVLYENTSNTSTDINEPCVESLGFLTSQVSEEKVGRWLGVVKKFAHEDQGFPTRLAALNSLIQYIDNTDHEIGPQILIVLWQFLSDDDPELREIARKFTVRYLKTGDHALPKIDSELFSKVSVDQEKAVPIIIDLFMGHGSLSDQINAALQPDEVLFSAEKPNLYRNDLDQLELLYNMLMNSSWVPDDKFMSWSRDALTSEPHFEGFLGELCNPEVLLVMTRVKYAKRLANKHDNAA